MTKPVRVVHYLDAVLEENGGVVRAVLDLVGALSVLGDEVTLMTGDATDAPAPWHSAPNVPRVVTFNRKLSPWLGLTPYAAQLAAPLLAEADVLHLHTPWDPVNVPLARLAKRLGKPYVLSIHGMLDDWSMAQRAWKKRLFLSLAGRRMLEGAAALHFTAEGERDQASKWAPRASPFVAPLVFDSAPFFQLPGAQLARDRFATPEGALRLLFLSRVNYKKGVDVLIEAVALLAERDVPAHAIIAGPADPGYQGVLEALATRLGIRDRVKFVGMVRGAEKLSLYQSADAFVLPTSQENFGIVLVEAMACGVPVVTTRGVDIHQELAQRGALVIDRTPAATADAVADILADRDSSKRRAELGAEEVLTWIDPKRVVAQYDALYRRVAAHD